MVKFVLWFNQTVIEGYRGTMYINTCNVPDDHLKLIQEAVSRQDPNGTCEEPNLMRQIVDIVLSGGYWTTFNPYQNNGNIITLYSL
jgi:hypothetical protein